MAVLFLLFASAAFAAQKPVSSPVSAHVSIPEEIEWTWEVRPPHPDPKLPNVLLLGDSLSRNYFPQVTRDLAGVANVYLMASSTSVGDPRLPHQIREFAAMEYDFLYDRDRNEFYGQVRRINQLLFGVGEGTMSHGEPWEFYLLGKYLERGCQTARILDVKYHLLLPTPDLVGTPIDNAHWMAILKSCSGYEPFHKQRHSFEHGTATPPAPLVPIDLIGGHLHYYRYRVGGRW